MSSRSSAVVAPALLLGGLAVGYLAGSSGRPLAPAADPAPAPPAADARFVMAHRLGANLYQMTSAEYRACCLQTYHLAGVRLEQVLADRKPARPAVVMDLDETVLDNSAFQTALYAAGREYDPALWDEYEGGFPADVGLVPGALEFIRAAEKLGVTPVFISNRSETLRAGTVAALMRLGVAPKGEDELAGRLLLKTGGSSDKAARREQAEARYNVLLWFGDNLRDFSEAFTAPKVDPAAGADGVRAAIAERNRLTDAAACHWGVDWFVLPNPVYGEWDKLIAAKPMAFLTPPTITFGKGGPAAGGEKPPAAGVKER